MSLNSLWDWYKVLPLDMILTSTNALALWAIYTGAQNLVGNSDIAKSKRTVLNCTFDGHRHQSSIPEMTSNMLEPSNNISCCDIALDDLLFVARYSGNGMLHMSYVSV